MSKANGGESSVRLANAQIRRVVNIQLADLRETRIVRFTKSRIETGE
jgi:hypothetical protein